LVLRQYVMFSDEFMKYLKDFPAVANNFLGTFPIDKFPDVLQKGKFFIANTAPLGHEG